jgi:putative transcription factor
MALCEMCGKESFLKTADVEGVDLSVCENCVKFGVVKKKAFVPRKSHALVSHDGPSFLVVKDYAQKIRQAREAKGMSQEDFAKFLSERASVVQKWESGHMRPRIGIARKIGKLLQIRLLEREGQEKTEEVVKRKVSDELTLGDFIKVRKRSH